MIAYEIRVKGHLDQRWSAWFDGMTITNMENGDTIISGSLLDQAALSTPASCAVKGSGCA